MVEKVGDKRYWEDWASSIGKIAQKQIDRIKILIENNEKHKEEFNLFLKGLQKNINTSVTKDEAIEMLSQHIITKPVFNALFENYSFIENNPMSSSMQKMLDLLETESLEEDTKDLKNFYESVKTRTKGIDNAEGRQKIIIELYDKFFKTAFPKMVEKLGIVYTPIEVVDFIINSVNDILQKEFKRKISDENIHILDPFTGTGTFITRLLQSNLIDKKDLERKYKNEIHANEIVLLAYYIATINIENVYHDLNDKLEYSPFDGICLTDTFQLAEVSSDDDGLLISEVFHKNSERVKKQKKKPIKIIIGNPPYSIGQKSANDNAQNQSYPNLDKRITDTYVKESTAGLNKSLYDAYIKAFRWGTDRISGGIICFVSNGGWLNGNSTDGFRKVIEKEFSSIYIFNLRGNQRTSKELSRKEGGKIFGEGARTPISITLLVKNPDIKTDKAKIYYHNIGDYLNRDEKLEIVKNFKSFSNMNLEILKPNKYGDWIDHRNEDFNIFISLNPDKKYNTNTKSFFITNSLGTSSNRDAWVYNFSKNSLKENISKTINYYNQQRELINSKQSESIYDDKLASWSRDWINLLKRNKIISENTNEYRISLHRPFTKLNIYFDDDLNQERYQLPRLFPTKNHKNLVIGITGKGSSKDFSVIISDIS